MNKSKHLLPLILLTLLTAGFTQQNPSHVTTVDSVDLNKYIGRWYEVAAIPHWFEKQCVKNTTAEYSFADDNLIRVDNSCDTSSGERDSSVGRARIEDTNSNSKLLVTFAKVFGHWIFKFGGPYWIVDLAPDYSYALIGDPTSKYAWVLARSQSLSHEILVSIEAKFKSLGYDTCTIVMSPQEGGVLERTPLCEIVK